MVEPFNRGVIAVLLVAFGIFLISLIESPAEGAERGELWAVILLYSFIPTNTYAFFLELVIAVLGGFSLANRVGSKTWMILFLMGFIYVGLNLLFNWIFPPI